MGGAGRPRGGGGAPTQDPQCVGVGVGVGVAKPVFLTQPVYSPQPRAVPLPHHQGAHVGHPEPHLLLYQRPLLGTPAIVRKVRHRCGAAEVTQLDGALVTQQQVFNLENSRRWSLRTWGTASQLP